MATKKAIAKNTPLCEHVIDIVIGYMSPVIIYLESGNPADINDILNKLSEEGSGSVRTH